MRISLLRASEEVVVVKAILLFRSLLMATDSLITHVYE